MSIAVFSFSPILFPSISAKLLDDKIKFGSKLLQLLTHLVNIDRLHRKEYL